MARPQNTAIIKEGPKSLETLETCPRNHRPLRLNKLTYEWMDLENNNTDPDGGSLSPSPLFSP